MRCAIKTCKQCNCYDASSVRLTFITQYAFYINLYMFISKNMKIFILIIVLISILNMKTTFSRGGGGGGGRGDCWPRKS